MAKLSPARIGAIFLVASCMAAPAAAEAQIIAANALLAAEKAAGLETLNQTIANPSAENVRRLVQHGLLGDTASYSIPDIVPLAVRTQAEMNLPAGTTKEAITAQHREEFLDRLETHLRFAQITAPSVEDAYKFGFSPNFAPHFDTCRRQAGIAFNQASVAQAEKAQLCITESVEKKSEKSKKIFGIIVILGAIGMVADIAARLRTKTPKP